MTSSRFSTPVTTALAISALALTLLVTTLFLLAILDVIDIIRLSTIFSSIRIPLIAVITITVFYFSRYSSKQIVLAPPAPVDPYTHSMIKQKLHKIEPGAFEKLIAHLLIFEGYPIVESGENRADQGIDLIIDRTNTPPGAVQCKRYIHETISYRLMEKFVNDMRHGGFFFGKYFTIIGFSMPARHLARANKIELWNADRITRVLQMHKARWPQEVYDLLNASSRKCSHCESLMTVLRTRYGAHKGKLHWRCKNYSCRKVQSFGAIT